MIESRRRRFLVDKCWFLWREMGDGKEEESYRDNWTQNRKREYDLFPTRVHVSVGKEWPSGTGPTLECIETRKFNPTRKQARYCHGIPLKVFHFPRHAHPYLSDAFAWKRTFSFLERTRFWKRTEGALDYVFQEQKYRILIGNCLKKFQSFVGWRDWRWEELSLFSLLLLLGFRFFLLPRRQRHTILKW